MHSEPQPLDPQRYGPWNAYMIPLKEHANTHYLEISLKDGGRLLVRCKKNDFLEVREGSDGKAEIVVPATAFEGSPLDMHHAEIKVIYNKKPAWYERIPILKSLGGIFEFLKKLFGGG